VLFARPACVVSSDKRARRQFEGLKQRFAHPTEIFKRTSDHAQLVLDALHGVATFSSRDDVRNGFSVTPVFTHPNESAPSHGYKK
jgi:hypothetical protein